jgi:hypothetical protein
VCARARVHVRVRDVCMCVACAWRVCGNVIVNVIVRVCVRLCASAWVLSKRCIDTTGIHHPLHLVTCASTIITQAEFKQWFSTPLTSHVEGTSSVDHGLVRRLHSVLRPFILRRLKSEVAKQLPQKVEHVVKCRLSNRQRYGD